MYYYIRISRGHLYFWQFFDVAVCEVKMFSLKLNSRKEI